MTRERTISASIVRWLNEQPSTWATAITAGAYTRRGLPDIFAIVKGQALVIEVKQPKAKLTPIQRSILVDIACAEAWAIVAHSLADAQHVHAQILADRETIARL